jgi:peptidoglycan/xylan/chitin deacetylase (PgdA/CDA1 family)
MIPHSLKRFLKHQIASPLVWPVLARWLPPAVVVLAYHRVSVPGDPFRHVDVATFRAQMEWLRRHCRIIGPDELRHALDRRSDRPAALVTFDDGYRDYREHAYPVLQSLNIPAVNFVATKFIDDGALFWWDILDLACRRTRLDEVSLPWTERRFDARTPAARMRIYRECQQYLKSQGEAEKNVMIPRVLDALQVSIQELAIPRQVMTWDQIRETTPLTTYGGHLHTHPLVSRIDAEQLEAELEFSHERMRQELGARPRLFAYPDGNITEAAKAALRRHDYDVAFGITEGFLTRGVDWFAVRRIPGPQSVADLAWRITSLLRLRNGS